MPFKSGKPIIYVGINFRLGFCGWLTSQELRDEALSAGERPFSNLGLLDQRLALQWVQQHISHFGGDSDNVTIAGESTGAWCVLAHLRSDVPVCKRGILMSTPSWFFNNPDVSQAGIDRLVAAACIKADALAAEKLAALRDMPLEQLIDLNTNVRLLPAWDLEWFVGVGFTESMDSLQLF